MLKGWEAYIHRCNIYTKLTIYVKVFHGSRQTHKITVSILDQISILEQKLNELDPTEMQQYFVSKLIYPMGSLRNMHNFYNKTFL